MSGVRTAVPLVVLAALVAVPHQRAAGLPARLESPAIRRLRVPRAAVGSCAVVAGAAVALLVGPAAAVAGALSATALARGRAAARAARAEDGVRAAAGEAVAVLAAELRAGRPPGAALDAAAGGPRATGPPQVQHVLAVAAAVARLGGDVPAALRESSPPAGIGPASRSAVRPLHRLGVAWQVSERAGAGLADVLDRVEDDVRAAARERVRLSTELAGTRATVRLLAGLPVLGVALASALGARPGHVLLATPIGGWCLVGAASFEVAGLAWARRIVARAHRRLP